MNVYEKKKVVYTAYSKHYYYAKMLISAFVLEKERIPLNPFANWEYFMDDMVDRDKIVRANNNLIYLSEEVWVFGPIADGVFEEIRLANREKKTVKYFSLGKKISDIHILTIDKIEFEDELLHKVAYDEIMNEIKLNKIRLANVD